MFNFTYYTSSVRFILRIPSKKVRILINKVGKKKNSLVSPKQARAEKSDLTKFLIRDITTDNFSIYRCFIMPQTSNNNDNKEKKVEKKIIRILKTIFRNIMRY